LHFSEYDVYNNCIRERTTFILRGNDMKVRKIVISIVAVMLFSNVLIWAEQGEKTKKPDPKERITVAEKAVQPAAPKTIADKPKPKQKASLAGLQEGVSLEEAIDIFRHSTNPPLNIVVLWNQLALANVEPYSTVTFNAMGGVSLKTNLELTLGSISRAQETIDFWVKDGIIIIGLADQKPFEKVTRLYNVMDITSPPSTGGMGMGGMGMGMGGIGNFGGQGGIGQGGQNNAFGQGNNLGQNNSYNNSSSSTFNSPYRSYRKALPIRQTERTPRKKTPSTSKATAQKRQFQTYGFRPLMASGGGGIGNFGSSTGLSTGGYGGGMGMGMGGMGMGGMGMGGMGMGGGMLGMAPQMINQNQQELKEIIQDTIQPNSWQRNNNNNQNNNNLIN